MFFISNEYHEMEKWIRGIQGSRAQVKERAKSKLDTVRNLYWVLKTLEDHVSEFYKNILMINLLNKDVIVFL